MCEPVRCTIRCCLQTSLLPLTNDSPAGYAPAINISLWNSIQLLFKRHAAAAPDSPNVEALASRLEQQQDMAGMGGRRGFAVPRLVAQCSFTQAGKSASSALCLPHEGKGLGADSMADCKFQHVSAQCQLQHT